MSSTLTYYAMVWWGKYEEFDMTRGANLVRQPDIKGIMLVQRQSLVLGEFDETSAC